MTHKIEQQQEIIDDIKNHMKMMVEQKMFVDSGLRAEYDLPMQIFRILQAYSKLLEEK